MVTIHEFPVIVMTGYKCTDMNCAVQLESFHGMNQDPI